ncbi:MAG: alpha/beta hydrolase [Candidatus Acidiferrales bacterium]
MATSDSSTEAKGRSGPLLLLALVLMLAAGAAASWYALRQLRAPLVFETFAVEDKPPIPVERVRLGDRQDYPAHFLLLPGYIANRRQLLPLAEVLATAGGDVFVVDLPGRGDHTGSVSPPEPEGPRAGMPTPREMAAALVVARALERRYGVTPERLVVVGHSMGGGAALDLARRLSPAAAISLSGLERPVGPGQPPNLLLITARFDFPPLRRAADRMYQRAHGGAQRREFLATHSDLPYHSSAQRAIVEWTSRALPGAGLSLPDEFNASRLALTGVTLLFLGALFFPLSALAGWALASEPFGEIQPETRLSSWQPLELGAYALLASGAAVSVLALLRWRDWPLPLGFLGLADGDYLASILLLLTLWLLPAWRHQPWVRSWPETRRKVAAALALALYVILVCGGFLTWQLFDLWPTGGRLLQILPLLLLFPYALGEELLVRAYAKNAREERALSGFLIWRAAILAAIVYGALVLGSGAGMLVLMSFSLTVLTLVEALLTAALTYTLGSVYACAVFKSLYLAWLFATVFPLR